MKTILSNKPVVIQTMALRILIIACLALCAQWFVRPALGQPWASYLVSTNAYWNVTDVTDPGQAVDIGELQAPKSQEL